MNEAQKRQLKAIEDDIAVYESLFDPDDLNSEWFPALNEEEWLENQIVHHKYCYYELGETEIDDNSYDLLEKRLKAINPQSLVLSIVGFKSIGRSKYQRLRYSIHREICNLKLKKLSNGNS